MQRIPLIAQERDLVGKKVKQLRAQGLIPAHVFGNQVETEHVSISTKDFIPVFKEAGETGLIDLKIGAEKIRPVMIKNLQYDPVKGQLLHIDFYQVNLNEKVTVPVPLVLKELEEEIEAVKMGEAVVLQVLSDVQVEALPTDLIDRIEVDISAFKAVDDSINVSQLVYDREKLTILADGEEVVVKLAPAVTEEMQKLLEEQEAEAEAATAEAAEGEEGSEKAEGEEGESTEGGEDGEKSTEESDKSGDEPTKED